MNIQWLFGKPIVSGAHFVWARAREPLKLSLVSAEWKRTQNDWERAQINAHFRTQKKVHIWRKYELFFDIKYHFWRIKELLPISKRQFAGEK